MALAGERGFRYNRRATTVRGRRANPMPGTAPLLRPRALVPGDRVAVVAPASVWDPKRLAAGITVLESWGLVVEPPPAAERHRYLAASDDARAAHLRDAFERDDVAAVMAVRGGFGSARLWGRFDAKAAAAHPKIFLGYSDLTLLLDRLVREAGLVCFHGPMVASDLARLGDEELARFRCFLFGESGWWSGEGLEALAPGVGEGRLAGGCLSMLVTTIGTPYEMDFAGRVLFLEDIAEPPYRIDRLLTHLSHAGKLGGVAAVVLGRFHDCGDFDEVKAIAAEILSPLGVPVVAGLDVGHHASGLPLPMGCLARVDASAGRVDLLEPVLDQAAVLATAAR